MCITVVIIAVMIVRCLDMIWAPGSVFPHTNKVFDGSIHFQVPYECTLYAYVMGNSSSSSSSAPKHSCQVVIVGGGYAGVKLAIDLDSYCKVVLIDPKDAFHHNMAGLRCIVEPAFVNKTLIPYEGVLKHGSFVKNRVVSCNISRKAVTLASSEEISYDYLVFACGSSVPFPGKVYLSILVLISIINGHNSSNIFRNFSYVHIFVVSSLVLHIWFNKVWYLCLLGEHQSSFVLYILTITIKEVLKYFPSTFYR